MKIIGYWKRLLVFGIMCALAATFAVSASAAEKAMKVGLVLPGRVNDPGYYNAGYQALLAAKEKYGAETTYQENLKPADSEQVLRVFAEDGFDYIIVMGGGNYDDQIRSVAADYPETRFIIVSGSFSTPPNIVSIRTGNPGVGYLAGILMAEVSKTGKIGLIGGRVTPPAIADHLAVIAGARAAKPNVEILDAYTEQNENPTLGKEAAIAQIEKGVDIIFTNANTTSFGVFQAAQEKNVLVVGAATDQNEVAPKNILSSVVYGMDNGVIYLIDLDRSGKGWEEKVYTMDLTLVNLAPFHGLDSLVSAETKKHLEEARQGLLSGSIVIPTTYEAVGMADPLKKK